jgi:hypothetical protein
VVERKVIVVQPPPSSSFPNWAFVPIVLLAIVLIVVVYVAFRPPADQANTNVNVSVAARRTPNEPVREQRTSSEPQAAAAPAQTTTVPGTSTSSPNVPPPDKGKVTINARVAPVTGQPQAARGTRFYLLDKDLETILSEARLQAIAGNTLSASLGLAAVYPDRYGDFQRAATKAISQHVKYSGTTSSGGTTDLKGIVPNSYYLFAISRVGQGFALWDQPVSVVVGDNVMNLSPQSVTEVPDPNG